MLAHQWAGSPIADFTKRKPAGRPHEPRLPFATLAPGASAGEHPLGEIHPHPARSSLYRMKQKSRLE